MMTFDEVLAQVLDLLRREGRVSYRALRRRFDLDADYLEDLKAEIIEAKRLAVDESGTVLVWTGETAPALAPEVSRPDRQQGGEEDRPAPEGERRQLTVMFCDLVGSTALSGQLDPEELREVVCDYQAACGAVIRRFEGHIAQYLGDGVLVYFGYPQAHEDDAARAVRAGLGIVEAVRRLNVRGQHGVGATGRSPLQVRVGVHTGLVVVGEVGGGEKHESLALGETPNLAARLQGLAEPDGVVISAATHRLIEGFFDCQDLGARPLKGVSQPVRVFRVLHESAARSRLEVGSRAGLTPLVGREQEMALLLERWERVREGMGQVVLLSGEAGIGKSRLAQVLKEHVANDPEAWLTPCQCSPYHTNSALYPVIDLLERVVLQLGREDSPQDRLSKLEGFLAQYGFSLPETAPLFASLLSIPLGERYAPLSLTPERQKQKTLEALLRVLFWRASQQPVLLVVEDLHWVDPTTLELLSLIVDQGPTVRVLALFTCRPDFSVPWAGRSHLTQVTLNRLTRQQAADMVERVARGKGLPGEVVEQVVVRTDGVPLFVEELTKMVLESGLLVEREGRYELTSPLPPLAIPATLQDSLMARLDRLATVKEVAQLGATLGREFTYELLRAVSSVDETTLRGGLARLVEAELLYPRGLPPQATYLFKHALIQEAAYQSLLKSRRQQYHQRIAQVLEERFSEIVEAQPELLAHHYTEAGLIEQAIPCWQRAGERAIQRSANVEAISHLTRGIELLKTLSGTPERIQRELDLQIALGEAFILTRGYAAPEVEHTYARAQELCQQEEETPQAFLALLGLCAFYIVRADYQTTRKMGEQFLGLARRLQDSALLVWAVWAHHVMEVTFYYLGEFASAREHGEQGISLYDSQQRRSLFFYIVDPGMACRAYASYTLWHLGYPDQALKRSHEALTLARDLSHPFTLAYALHGATWVHQLRREPQEALQQAEELIALTTEQAFSLYLGWGSTFRGWTLAEQGQVEEGIVQIRQGMAALRATGAEFLQPYILALLAEAYGKGGQPEEGLRALAEALTAVEKTGERFYEAELYRLKGELLRQTEDGRQSLDTPLRGYSGQAENLVPYAPSSGYKPRIEGQTEEAESEAETCFHKAIEVARGQQAKSLELRATVSLCRLWQGQGKREEARQILQEIYDWFTEGFDTADLKEARALLETLGKVK